ncbi:hypothetical protein H4582DRAFT_2063629 [Lactarius indigo]|nr:hypothetical protein H4582DRAFT_2063629 [Lactarius indigo]
MTTAVTIATCAIRMFALEVEEPRILSNIGAHLLQTPTRQPSCLEVPHAQQVPPPKDEPSAARFPNPPQSPIPSPSPSHQPTAQTLSVKTEGYGRPDTYDLTLLAWLDSAAQELPIRIPEAEAHNEIARISSVGDPDGPSEAWEYLDPVLNRLLGFGSGVEDAAWRVRRGPLGIEGLGRLIHRFVLKRGVTGDLLEGKIGTLL